MIPPRSKKKVEISECILWIIPEEGLRGLGLAGEHELALGALGEERAHHFVGSEIPPWHVDEHLHTYHDPTKLMIPFH